MHNQKEREREREKVTQSNQSVLALIPLVGKFRPWLIELTSFKPKLLIRFIMNKPC